MSLSDFIVKLIDDIAKQEQFIDYQTEFSNELKRGENFTGKVVFLQINGTRSLESDANAGIRSLDSLHLVLKTAPSSPYRRQVFQVVPGFKCEVEMYTKIIPAFAKFQEEKNLKAEDKFLSFPKMYATICDEAKYQFAIILEDLRIKNYKILSKSEGITHEHAKLVMNGLAKYHAISFALKDQKPNLFQEIVQKDTLSSRFMKDDLGYEIINILDRSIEALEMEKHKDLVRDLKVTYIDWVEKFADHEFIGESGVLLHGDCWSNNVIFQYDNNNDLSTPLQVMFLDWQMTRYGGPPIIDLCYFLLSTTDKSFRDKYFTSLLSEYYATLSSCIEKLGSDPEKMYPLSRYQSDLMTRFNRFPLLFALVSVMFRVIDEKHVLDLDEYAERICNGERPRLISNFDNDTETLYRKLLNDSIVDVIHYCIMSIKFLNKTKDKPLKNSVNYCTRCVK